MSDCDGDKKRFYGEQRPGAPAPLKGVRVLEATTTWFGPRFGQLLWDHTDEVLKEVASLMRESFRATDYLGRYGGEEFAAVLVN